MCGLKIQQLKNCVLVAISAWALSFTSNPAWGGDNDPTVVVLFGDSLTLGFNSNYAGNSPGDPRRAGGTTERGCPTIYLKVLLLHQEPRGVNEDCPTVGIPSPVLDANDEKRDVIVANWGLGGSTSARGVQRITAELNETTSQFPAKDHLVLIMYGTNDFGSNISTSMTRFNTVEMIRKAQAAGYTPIIGTLTPRDDRDITPYNAQIVNAANQEGVFIVDHFARFVAEPAGWRSLLEQEISLITGDLIRLHPTDHGYLVLAETWFDKRLKDIIEPDPELSITPLIYILLDD